jgi:hypothetical protein
MFSKLPVWMLFYVISTVAAIISGGLTVTVEPDLTDGALGSPSFLVHKKGLYFFHNASTEFRNTGYSLLVRGNSCVRELVRREDKSVLEILLTSWA